MAATFEYWLSPKDFQYYFHLREDGNREIILASTEGYVNEQGCINGIDSIKRHSPFDNNYFKITGADSKYYFTLKAVNNEPIGKSEGYSTASSRDHGIQNCKIEAPRAPVRKIFR